MSAKRKIDPDAYQWHAEHARQAMVCAGVGLEREEIALVLGIALEDLEAHYAEALRDGEEMAHQGVRRNLHHLATQDDYRALKAIETWLCLVEKVAEPRPKPRQRRLEPLGKKEKANQEAEAPPDEGSTWSDLLH